MANEMIFVRCDQPLSFCHSFEFSWIDNILNATTKHVIYMVKHQCQMYSLHYLHYLAYYMYIVTGFEDHL